jgi:hypothetical protein
MNPGDVILVKGDNHNLLDLGVMHASHSVFSHTAIAVSATDVVEATYPKVRRTEFYWNDANSAIVVPPYSSQENVDKAVNMALSFVGEHYDVVGLADMLMFELSTGLTRDAVVAVLQRWSKLPVLWCSEAVARCLVAAALKFPNLTYITTPGDIANFLNCRVPALLPADVSPLQWSTSQSPTFRLHYNQALAGR